MGDSDEEKSIIPFSPSSFFFLLNFNSYAYFSSREQHVHKSSTVLHRERERKRRSIIIMKRKKEEKECGWSKFMTFENNICAIFFSS
jgi:hypothetical protein